VVLGIIDGRVEPEGEREGSMSEAVGSTGAVGVSTGAMGAGVIDTTGETGIGATMGVGADGTTGAPWQVSVHPSLAATHFTAATASSSHDGQQDVRTLHTVPISSQDWTSEVSLIPGKVSFMGSKIVLQFVRQSGSRKCFV